MNEGRKEGRKEGTSSDLFWGWDTGVVKRGWTLCVFGLGEGGDGSQ